MSEDLYAPRALYYSNKYNNGKNKVYLNLLFTPWTSTCFGQPCGHFQGCNLQRL